MALEGGGERRDGNKASVHSIENGQDEIIKALNLKFSDQKRLNFGITSDGLCECTDVEGSLRSIVQVSDGY
jgi:hypothetical protein